MKVLSVICLFLSIQLLLGNELIDGLKNQIYAVANQLPGNYQTLVANLRGWATADASYFQPAQFNSEMDRFGFPQDIRNKFQNIIWSYSVAFQTFTASYINNHFEHEEFVGIGRNSNGLISIAFVKGHASGDNQKAIDKVARQQRCNSCPRADCAQYFRCYSVEQDFAITNNDLITIDSALRAYSFQLALGKLNTMNGMENSLENFYRYEEEQQKHDEEQKSIKQQLLEYKENCQNLVKTCPDQIQEKCVFLECIKKDLTLTEKVLCNFKVEQCKKILDNEEKIEKECKQCICLQNKVISKGNVFDCF